MSAKKISKRLLKSLINDAFKDALRQLDLPPATKKIKKHIGKNAEKIAAIYADVMKKEDKRQRKTEKQMARALMNSNGKKSAGLKPDEPAAEENASEPTTT